MGKEKQGTGVGYIAVYTKGRSINIFGNATPEAVFDIDGQRFAITSFGQYRGD